MKGPEYCESRLKTSLDFAIAGGAISITSPLWGLMSIYNKRRNEPLFFNQERTGKEGNSFMMVKFETLYTGAENEDYDRKSYHCLPQEREKKDPRIKNRAMAFMRQTGLNELPQMLNVLRGEMSIVGPRPLPLDYIEEATLVFPEITKEWRKTALKIKPGVVGVSPLKTRRIPIEEFDQRAELDMIYVQEATFWRDIQIITQAFAAMRP